MLNCTQGKQEVHLSLSMFNCSCFCLHSDATASISDYYCVERLNRLNMRLFKTIMNAGERNKVQRKQRTVRVPELQEFSELIHTQSLVCVRWERSDKFY